MDPAILTFDNPQAAANACADRTFELLDMARTERGVAFLAVSGGSTPKPMFQYMAEAGFDWRGVHIFWVDERCVPPDNDQSNFRMTRESLIDRIQIDPGQIHRIQGERDPEQAAALYVSEIRGLMGDQPVFDVVQRGMGPDAHTASLFPGEPMVADRAGIAAALWVEKMKQHRVTLLRGVLERARATLCLVSGPEKAEALYRVLRAPYDPARLPAQIASSETTWYLDRAAAARLAD